MSKHTPGPWKTVDDDFVYALTEMGDGRETNRFYAGVQRGHGCTAEEVAANARLIAAAPDLLEACKKAYTELNFCVEMMGRKGGEYEVARDQLRNAIAKAEGLVRQSSVRLDDGGDSDLQEFLANDGEVCVGCGYTRCECP